MSWRDKPATDKQKMMIESMWEFSEFPLPDINLETATKGECADYIQDNMKLAHTGFNFHEDAGDRI